MASQAQVQAVEVYTTNEPCMVKAMEYKGLVLASKVKSRNVFSDIGAGFKSMVGGEIKGMSKLTSDLRDELLWELKEKAANVGANAIVGLRYVGLDQRPAQCIMSLSSRMETNSVFEGMLDMVVCGTAVFFTR